MSFLKIAILSCLVYTSAALGPLNSSLSNFKLVWDKHNSSIANYVDFGNHSFKLLVNQMRQRNYNLDYSGVFSVALKSEFYNATQNSTQFIMETQVGDENTFHLFVNNGQLSWSAVTWPRDGNETHVQYDCSDVQDLNSAWINLLVVFNTETLRTKKEVDVDIWLSELNTSILYPPAKKLNCIPVTHKDNAVKVYAQQTGNAIRLGRQFRGMMAYGALYFHSRRHENNFNRFKFPSTIQRDRYTTSPKLNWEKDLVITGSIRKEMENQLSMKYYTKLECTSTSLKISLNPLVYNISNPAYAGNVRQGYRYIRKYNYPMNLTMGNSEHESNCSFTWVPNPSNYRSFIDLKFQGNLTSCGFKRIKNGEGKLVYRNKIYAVSNNASEKLLDVACGVSKMPTVTQNVKVEAFAVNSKNLILAGSAEHPHLKFSINFFADQNFSRKVGPSKVANEETLYAEASVESNNPRAKDVRGVKLDIQSCETTVALNSLSSVSHKLIVNRKVVEKSFRFLNTGVTYKKRFQFQAMRFEKFPDAIVYLDCVMSASDNEFENKKRRKGTKDTKEKSDEIEKNEEKSHEKEKGEEKNHEKEKGEEKSDEIEKNEEKSHEKEKSEEKNHEKEKGEEKSDEI